MKEETTREKGKIERKKEGEKIESWNERRDNEKKERWRERRKQR